MASWNDGDYKATVEIQPDSVDVSSWLYGFCGHGRAKTRVYTTLERALTEAMNDLRLHAEITYRKMQDAG